MNTFKLAALTTVAALSVGVAAHAADGPSVAFNAGVASDYVFRGISQTDSSPQLFGGADLTMGTVYAGTWLSNVDFGNNTSMEYDFYAGVKPTLGPVALDLGVVYYGYGNQPANSNEDYWEGKVAGSMSVGKSTVGAAVYYSPEFFGKTGKATYLEINAARPLTEKLSVSGAIGQQKVDTMDTYSTWNLGVGYALTSKLGVDLRYIDTDAHGLGSLYKSRAVVSLKATF